MILSDGDMANYHRLRNDLEESLSTTMTAAESKNKARALMQMFAAKGYSIHNTTKEAK